MNIRRQSIEVAYSRIANCCEDLLLTDEEFWTRRSDKAYLWVIPMPRFDWPSLAVPLLPTAVEDRGIVNMYLS